MTISLKQLWVEKYRPSVIEDYIFQNPNHKLKFLKMITDRSIPHLLLSGSAGTGKTTLAKILISEMNVDPDIDVLTIKASDTNSVDTIRNDIKDHIMTVAMSEFKIVHLEEADYLSLNAQACLRTYMEDYADSVRFVLTCNYKHKIMPAIRSRCNEYDFKAPDINSIEPVLIDILDKESITYNIDTVREYIAAGYPDIRKIIQYLDDNSINGKLVKSSTEKNNDYKFEMLDLLIKGEWTKIRTLLCSQVANDEWEDVYRFLYNNLDKAFKGQKYEQSIVLVADYLYKHAICADPEINFAALVISLSQI